MNQIFKGHFKEKRNLSYELRNFHNFFVYRLEFGFGGGPFAIHGHEPLRPKQLTDFESKYHTAFDDKTKYSCYLLLFIS